MMSRNHATLTVRKETKKKIISLAKQKQVNILELVEHLIDTYDDLGRGDDVQFFQSIRDRVKKLDLGRLDISGDLYAEALRKDYKNLKLKDGGK